MERNRQVWTILSRFPFPFFLFLPLRSLGIMFYGGDQP